MSRILNGSTDRLRQPDMPGTVVVSISLWIRINALPPSGTTDCICTFHEQSESEAYTTHDKGLYLSSAGAVRAYVYAGAVRIATGTTPLPTGTWHQVGLEAGGGVLSVIVDGVRESTIAAGSSYSFSNAAFTIGALVGNFAFGGTMGVFDGRVADVGVWTRTLTEAEWRALAQATRPDALPDTSGLQSVAYFDGDLDDEYIAGDYVATGTTEDTGDDPTPTDATPRVTAVPVLVTSAGGVARVTASPVLVTTAPRAPVQITAAMVLVTSRPVLPEDGTVPAGTNPPTASLPSETPQFFGVLEDVTDGTILEAHAEMAGGPFNDDADWFGGYKERRTTSFGNITRRASTPTGGIQASSQTVTFDDADRFFLSSWGITRRFGRKWSNYVVDHGVRLSKGEPLRLSAGLVANPVPAGSFSYQFEVQGMLGRHITKASEAMVPPLRLTPDDLPSLLSTKFSDGWSPPTGYGFLEDESAPNPQGVVPSQYVGTANLQTIFGPGAININADFHVFFGHAVQDTLNLYITPPGWTPSTAYLAGDVVRTNLTSNGYLYRCTVAGTSGSSAPTWSTTIGATFTDGGVTWIVASVDDPELRYRVPAEAYGQIIAIGHKPGWGAVTGTSVEYVDWNGYRFTVAVVRSDHRFARALRENRMSLTGNFRAIEDVGDGTGALITAPSRIFQHFRTNYVENSYKTGAWFPVPAFGGYSLFDTDTVEAVHVVTHTLVSGGPVRASLLIGAGGKQITAFEAEKQMASSWDLLLGENPHGQIALGIDVPAAPAVATFHQQHDICRIRAIPRRSGYANTVRYRFAPRYAPPVATQLEGEQGQPMPAKPLGQYAEWISGLLTIPDDDALDANDGVPVYLDLDLYGVRDPATAEVLARRALARAVGPTLEGPIDIEIVTGLQGLQQDGQRIDLHSVVAATSIEGLGPDGFVDARARIEVVDIQPESCVVTLMGPLLPEPPA